MNYDNVLANLSLGEILTVVQPIVYDLANRDIQVKVRLGGSVDSSGSEPIIEIEFLDDDSKVSYRLIYGSVDELREKIMDSLVNHYDEKEARRKQRWNKVPYSWDDYL